MRVPRQLSEPFWRIQRPVVDTARGLIAGWQSLPRPPADGPLRHPHAEQVLGCLDDHPLVQPDRTSCGSSTLTMLRMLRDPSYSASILDQPDPATRFGPEALGVRLRTNAGRDARGQLQLPWPAALGTRPAAMVRLLEAPEGYGATRTRYHTVQIDPAHAEPAWHAVTTSIAGGEPVPFFVGNGHWMQHIVLIVRATESEMSAYDPACGRVVTVSWRDFLAGTMWIAGWSRPWLIVLAGD